MFTAGPSTKFMNGLESASASAVRRATRFISVKMHRHGTAAASLGSKHLSTKQDYNEPRKLQHQRCLPLA